ncbi:MAG: Si-specific NAD(P)(+) transhydrogenase [candidate division Zixibacteria bacterium]|nr:Si-specific NAD(P)(+) transhydrogenase [candidate division Zixibacteria bacterium]
MNIKEYDLIVIGSGPAGEKAAIQASKLRKSIAIIERHSVQGGVCIHTGTIPSKTLRETVMYIAGLRQRSVYGMTATIMGNLSLRELMYRKDQVIQQELDIIQQNMSRYRIDVIQGTGVIADPNTVVVSDGDGNTRFVKAKVIIISTGTKPYHPEHIQFDNKYIYDGESIIDIDIIPRSLTIVGGGVIGCEYASIFGHIGTKVTIVDDREKLLSFLDREIADTLIYLMRKYRINLILGDGAKEVTVENNQVVTTTKSGREVTSDRLLYAAGRTGNTENLGLETVNIEMQKYGLIKVNDMYRTSCPNIYAVGDVIGFPSLASVSMDQGRLAARHAFETKNTSCINNLLPFGIYTIPEVSMIGETEESLSKDGQDYEIGIAHYYELARGQIINDHDGMLKIIFDPNSKRILGVHIVGERATELIHIGQAVMTLGGTLEYFHETVFNYPTLSEAYKIATLDGFARLNNRN